MGWDTGLLEFCDHKSSADLGNYKISFNKTYNKYSSCMEFILTIVDFGAAMLVYNLFSEYLIETLLFSHAATSA